jgi:excisionase family DNA binding protein
LPADVEAAMRKHRFGPALDPLLSPAVLRERVPAKVICEWLTISRQTLKRRMADGEIPYYRVGQTFRFAVDEIRYSLGIADPSTPVLEELPDISMGGLP